MSRHAALELTAERIRAIIAGGWSYAPRERFELKWDPNTPDDAVAVLRAHLGAVATVAIAVGMDFLHVKHVALPPVSNAERRGILTLEPDRFFAVDGEIVAAVRDESDLVFALDSELSRAWVNAFEKWAPVVCIEPSPESLARALGKARARDGLYSYPMRGEDQGVAEIGAGVLRTARRAPASEVIPAAIQLPSVKQVPSEFLAAWGAALGRNGALEGMLLSGNEERRVLKRRRGAIIRSALNCSLALFFAIASIDRSRTRLLEREQQEIAALSPRAAAGAAFQERLARIDVETAAARNTGAAVADPLMILAVVSKRLPRDASVMSIRSDGNAWQIDGTARDAARIVPALDAEGTLENVRSLSATSRFNENGRMLETFSVAFDARR